MRSSYANSLTYASVYVSMRSSVSKLIALNTSLEIKLAEVGVVLLLDGPTTIEVEESCTTEVYLSWMINESTHNVFLDTAAACHLFKFLLI
jgi:hypothetical protein